MGPAHALFWLGRGRRLCCVTFVVASPSARAADFGQGQPAAASQASDVTECGLLRRAISRRACMARVAGGAGRHRRERVTLTGMQGV